MAGHGGDLGLLGDFLGGDLVAHLLDRANGWPDEGDASGFQRLGEFGVFRQEAVARMHGLGPGLLDRVHHLVDHDIGLVGGWWADMHRLVGHADMQRVAVGV